MAMRVIAILTDPATAATCLHAAGAAASDGGKVEALHVRVPPEQLILPSEEVLTRQRRHQLERRTATVSFGLNEIFEDWRQSIGPLGSGAEWHEVSGEVGAEVAAHTRSADLVALARPSDDAGREALHSTLFVTRQLTLVVPPAHTAHLGRHLAVAWKVSEQAERALYASLPWLKRAERVSILMAIGENEPLTAPERLLAALAREGVAVGRLAIDRVRSDVGEHLLGEAHAIGADGVVMGAYQHSPIAEMLLGGVTRFMLHHADLPVFMMH